MSELSREAFVAELVALHHSEARASGSQSDEMPMLVRLQMRYRAGDNLSARDADILKLCTQLFRNEIESLDCDERLLHIVLRLQIPVLVAALENSGFFGRDGHPARDLIHRIAGLLLDSGGMPGDELESLTGLLASIVDEICAVVPCPDEVYRRSAERLAGGSAPLTDLSGEPLEPAVARRLLAAELQQRAAQRNLPPIMRELIEQGWSRVLYSTLLKSGQGAEWRDHVALLDELLQSLSADLNVKHRNRVLEMLPEWLEELRRGLTRAGNLTPRMVKVLEETRTLILQRLQVSAAGSGAGGGADAEDPILSTIQPGTWINDRSGPTEVRWRISGVPRRAGCFVLRSASGRELRKCSTADFVNNIKSGIWTHDNRRDGMIVAVDQLRQQARQLRAKQS